MFPLCQCGEDCMYITVQVSIATAAKEGNGTPPSPLPSLCPVPRQISPTRTCTDMVSSIWVGSVQVCTHTHTHTHIGLPAGAPGQRTMSLKKRLSFKKTWYTVSKLCFLPNKFSYLPCRSSLCLLGQLFKSLAQPLVSLFVLQPRTAVRLFLSLTRNHRGFGNGCFPCVVAETVSDCV